MNSLLALGWQDAIITKKLHRLHFFIGKKEVVLEERAEGVDAYGNPNFKPVQRAYVATNLAWPANLEIRQFVIEGSDEMQAHGQSKTKDAWFYITPAGIAQNVTIMLVDTKDRTFNRKARQIELILNPFTVQVSAHEVASK